MSNAPISQAGPVETTGESQSVPNNLILVSYAAKHQDFADLLLSLNGIGTTTSGPLTEEQVGQLADVLASIPPDFDELKSDQSMQKALFGSKSGNGDEINTLELIAGLSNAGLSDEEICEAVNNFGTLSPEQQNDVLGTLAPTTQGKSGSASWAPPTAAQKQAADSLLNNVGLVAAGLSDEQIATVLSLGLSESEKEGLGALLAVGAAKSGQGTVTEDQIYALSGVLGLDDEERQGLLDAGIVSVSDLDTANQIFSQLNTGVYRPDDLAAALNSGGGAGTLGVAATQSAIDSLVGYHRIDDDTYALVLDAASSMSMADIKSALASGDIEQDQADMLMAVKGMQANGASDEEIKNALVLMFGIMSPEDAHKAATVLSVPGDDSAAMAQFVGSGVQYDLSAESLLDIDDFEAQAQAALSFAPSDINSFVSDDFTQADADRLIVGAAMVNAGLEGDDLTAAMATYDSLSDVDKAYIVEQCSDRTLAGSNCFGDLGVRPDYSQSKLAFDSSEPTDTQTYICDYLVNDVASQGVTVQDFVSVTAAAVAAAEESDFELPENADEAQARAYCENMVTGWDDMSTEQQDMIINYYVASSDPDNTVDEDGNIVDPDGNVVAPALSQEAMAAAGLSDAQEISTYDALLVALGGRLDSQQDRVRQYADQVELQNQQMDVANEVESNLESNEPTGDDTLDITQMYVTDADGNTVSYSVWLEHEGIGLPGGSDPTKLTPAQVDQLENEVDTYAKNKGADAKDTELELQDANNSLKATIELMSAEIKLFGDLQYELFRDFPEN